MYIILETQTYTDGTVGTLINTYTDINEAESNYHKVLMAAAISTIPIHTAFMLTDSGQIIKSESYKHEIKPEEPEE